MVVIFPKVSSFFHYGIVEGWTVGWDCAYSHMSPGGVVTLANLDGEFSGEGVCFLPPLPNFLAWSLIAHCWSFSSFLTLLFSLNSMTSQRKMSLHNLVIVALELGFVQRTKSQSTSTVRSLMGIWKVLQIPCLYLSINFTRSCLPFLKS